MRKADIEKRKLEEIKDKCLGFINKNPQDKRVWRAYDKIEECNNAIEKIEKNENRTD